LKSIFFRVALGWATLAGLAHAVQSDTLTPRWTHVSGYENWIGRAVTLGNEGTEVFTALEAGVLTSRLFAEGSTGSTASPVWQVQDANSTYYFAVASCESRSLHAVARTESVSGGQRVAVRAFTSAGSGPAWTFTSTPQASTPAYFQVLIPDAGDKVVVTVPGTAGATEVRVLDAVTGAVLHAWSANLYGPVVTGAISANGAALYLASGSCASVLDTATGTLRFQTWFMASAGRLHGFSADGATFAFGVPGEVRCFRRNAAGTWSQAFTVPVPSTSACDAVGLSRDGSRLGLGWTNPLTPGLATGQVVDVAASIAAGSAQVLWNRVLGTAQGWSNSVADVRLSRDGRVAAFGLLGDQGGTTPEVVVVTDDGATMRSANLPGSVQRIALSADGRHLAVGSKSVHNTTPMSDGRIDYFELGAGDLLVHGAPRAGATLTVEITTTPNAPVVLMIGSQGSTAPTYWGAIGASWIPRTAISALVNLGTSDANGLLLADFALPSSTIGASFWLQGIGLQPRRLTLDFCKLTVIP